jgi:molybdopterin/thiamine biosynthesis adenylyltransferase
MAQNLKNSRDIKTINVMIAGGGGNNSWLMKHLCDLQTTDQIPDWVIFTIYDGDNIEKKNLLYQNFTIDDLLENKAEVLGKRYTASYVSKYINNPKEFDKFDVVICGVDNVDFREMLFKYMEKHPEKYWIDLRAEGRSVAAFSRHPKNTLKILLESLPKNGESTSCQLEYELKNGVVQMGNRIAAVIGAQYFLNYLRGEINPPSYIHMF